ncbi:hypothetical protein MWN34_12395 [Ancylobacter sp. 6x-1]|uniref:Uncharacterized protein n=1 Tax=Ancylobacter crimeensis TaxID=2579147 RepID=A0ABT0DCN4_9HYPH|nr:hypothetical protein [Ancylobacter crimeensis]MCK0197714.1 hypothetical protein [Ancylobacter crimeensis]
MIRKMIVAAALFSLVGAGSALAAEQCKDAKGKFIKCPAPAATMTAPAAPAVTKDANGKCHVASGPKKGQFAACPS